MLCLLEGVEKFYGADDVLRDASLMVRAGDRLALVGRNGAGKSTILRILAGLEEATGGRVVFAPGLSVRMLAQDPEFAEGASVESALEGAFKELDALEEALQSLEQKMQAQQDSATVQAQLEAYHELQEHYRLRGGYARGSRRDAVLNSLGFGGREHEAVQGLSGGERTRLALAQILVAQPELLLLDEPTNHLDIVMLEWLEGFLHGYPGAVLVVSHDRAFLDAVVNRVAFVARGETKIFEGNYSHFKEKWALELEMQARVHANQKRELERLERATEQMRIWGGRNEKLAIRARGMQKRVDRFEADMIDAPPPEEAVVKHVAFNAPESGEVVLQAGHLRKAYGGRVLFENVDLTIRAKEKIAVVGRNGAGKSTLVRCMLGLLKSDDARAYTRLGSRVKLGYYDQQLRGVDPERTVFEEVLKYVNGDQEAFDLLGAYLFPYSAQRKKVAVLSGGERARLALLKLSLEPVNLLVMDEPTNHLDLEMLELLERALKAYTGTLVLISHDRRFLGSIASRTWIVEDAQVFDYPGGYGYAKEKHAQLLQPKPIAETPTAPVAKPKPKGINPWKIREEIARLETEIKTTEEERDSIAAQLAAPTANTDFATLGARASSLEETLATLYERWSEQNELLGDA